MEEHPQARKIVETLAKAGFVAYYAGGWVRDFLLQHPSDDIDIATNAPPETIQALFPHTVPVGIAFGIVLVVMDGHPYEVATFRQDFDYQDGRRPSKIVFTTAIEDAKRRDFTINGMFYDPLKEEVLDYVHGRADLEAKIIRAIGNPHERIKEDRLRMIRAVRLACRFGFQIEEATEKAIRAHAKELFPAVAIERIWQEFTKGHDFGKLRPMLLKLHEFDLLETIFPGLKDVSPTEMETRLLPIKDYPAQAPTIAFLLPLFPSDQLSDRLALCKKLKLSNLDQQFVTILTETERFLHFKRAIERVEWAHFYANAFAPMCLQILSAHMEPEKRQTFLQHHEDQMKLLSKAIQRIKIQDPVVRSSDLVLEGIEPGKTMGLLLKEAERIAINEQIDDPSLVIERLKRSSLWPN